MMQAERGPCIKKREKMQEPSKEWVDRTNREMAECVLDYIRSALEHFGVPKGTFADDQFDNFVALYNQRGDMITAMNGETNALRDRISSMEGILVEIANWPNPENHPQMQAMKIWAASVIDPRKVTMLGSLTNT
jgi:hypothetical protein